MNNEMLPVGTIVKLNDDKLVMISGYWSPMLSDFPGCENIYGGTILTDISLIKSRFNHEPLTCSEIYAVTAYPLDPLNLSCNPKSILKQYNWYYNSTCTFIKATDIKEIIFMGYRNEEYTKLMELFKK